MTLLGKLCALALLLVAAACSRSPLSQAPTSSDSSIEVDAQTQGQLGLELMPAGESSSGAALSATGQFQLNEDKSWQVGAVIEGKIIDVPVRLGQQVRAGQVLAEMHSHEVHDARASLRQAEAELSRVRVVADQALRVRDRTQRLLELKAASREQIEAAETHYRSALLSVEAAQAEVEKVQTHITEFLEIPLKKPDGNSSDGHEGDHVAIRAPASGTVMARLANAGSVVSAGQPVIALADLHSLWLIAAVNEADLSHIARGQKVDVSVRAYPDRTFPGTIFQLGERMDRQTRTLQVRVTVQNSEGLLKPDMFATMNFTPRAVRSTIRVPESAVQQIEGKQVVFIRSASGSFEPRAVVTGKRIDRQIEILSGIAPGTPVVINGSFLLKSQLTKGESD